MALRSYCLSPWLLVFSNIVREVFISGELVIGKDALAVGGNDSEFIRLLISSTYDKSWCIAKDHAKPDTVQESLDWACGLGGADCLPIRVGNGCFLPNTVYSHASFAFNSYYQIHDNAPGTCDFDGVATVTYTDPSYPGCSYPYRIGQILTESKGNKKCMSGHVAFGGVISLFILIF